MLAVKWGILLLILWAIRRTLYQAWQQLGQAPWELAPGWLIVAGGLYLLGLLPAATFWYVGLRRLGQRPGWLQSLRAYCIGGLGKYVPGKAMVVILRVGLIRSPGVHTAVAAASVFLETLTMMCVGAFWAAIFLGQRALQAEGPPALLIVAVVFFAVALISTLPPVFRTVLLWVLRRLPPGSGRDNDGNQEQSSPETMLASLRMDTLALGWVLMSGLWLLWGGSYLAVLESTGQVAVRWPADLWPATAAVALATVAGFAVVVLPGGLGVREAALAEIVLPLLAHRTAHPELLAVVAAALLRVVWVLAEVAASAILMMIRPKQGSGVPVRS
jgi:uncharacterized membrane protein YbhN (UPF0104 family)